MSDGVLGGGYQERNRDWGKNAKAVKEVTTLSYQNQGRG